MENLYVNIVGKRVLGTRIIVKQNKRRSVLRIFMLIVGL